MPGRIGNKFFSRTLRREDPNSSQRAFFGSLAALLVLTLVTAATLWAHDPGDAAPSSGWHWRADVILVVGVLAAVYLRGWRRLKMRHARAVSRWHLVSYLGGLTAIFIALLSPIDARASVSFSAHMIQHLALLMIAPLSLLLANPLTATLWGLPGPVRLRLGHLLSRSSPVRRALRLLTFMPVSWALYVLNLWAWHHPVLYQLALTNEWAHDLQHLLFFSTSLLFWWPVVNPSPRLHGEISYGYRVIYLVAATLQNTLLGMAISLPERVLYPLYASVPKLQALAPIDDQALGGGIMWVSGHMYLIPILILIARMFAHEEDTLRKRSAEQLPKRA